MTTYRATFEEKLAYNQRFVKYSFEMKEPFRFEFQAGQAIVLEIAPGVTREYFIFSSPAIDHGFEILVDEAVGGDATTYLQGLEFGEVINFSGPSGDFVMADPGAQELVLVATGVGVAPLYAMILDLLQVKSAKNPITLYWGLEKLEDLFLVDDLAELTKDFPNFIFHPVVGEALPEWNLCRGAVTDCLSVHQINADAEFYFCGDKMTVERLVKLCLTNTVKNSQLHFVSYN